MKVNQQPGAALGALGALFQLRLLRFLHTPSLACQLLALEGLGVGTGKPCVLVYGVFGESDWRNRKPIALDFCESEWG